MEPAPPAVEAWSLNHWTSREVPRGSLLVTMQIESWFGLDLRVGRREESRLTQVVDLGGRLGGGTVLSSVTIIPVYGVLGCGPQNHHLV